MLDARPEDALPPYLPHTPRAAEAELEAEAECDECPAREPPGTALEPTPEPTAGRGTQAVQGAPGEARRRPPCAKQAPPPCSPSPPPPSLTVGLSAQAVCLAAASAVAVAALLVAASRRGSR